MEARGVLCVVFLVVVTSVLCVQGLMFYPIDGEVCSDNIDCEQGCCLMTGFRHRRPTGICQPMNRIGEYCAPGTRLRNYYGTRVYTYSCPCAVGLKCMPRWSTQKNGRSVMEDPKCIPFNIHPSVLAMKDLKPSYNPYEIPSVPAE